MKYIKQLDSVRAIAVVLVVLSHWVPKINVWRWGEIGVDIFFVLSGFLISMILLEAKESQELHVKKDLWIVRSFVIRRALRIFPLYYLIVLIHFLIDENAGPSIRASIVYHLTYTSNIYFYSNPQFNSLFTHFWSLSVEEQFYLFWPWIIIFLKREKLVYVITLFFIASTLYSFIPPDRVDKLMPACLGTFSIGALLAYFRVQGIAFLKVHYRLINTITIVSIVLLSLFPLYNKLFNPHSITRLFTSIISFRLIMYCLYERDSRALNLILNLKPLIFIGKISYGIYLIHTLVPWIWRSTISFFTENGIDFYLLYSPFPEQLYNSIDLIFKFGLTVLFAWISWKYFESPIIGLKKYFGYKK